MARPTKLTPQVFDQIEYLLGLGTTIEVLCNAVGITSRTYYTWRGKSEALCALADASDTSLITLEDVPLIQFFPMTQRAGAQAHVLAVNAITTALLPQHTLEQQPYTYRETRFRKDKDGNQVPYVYEETRLLTVEKVTPPDWRAAFEFLKRRDPAAWNPPTKVEVSFEEQAVAYIRAGEIDFWDMVNEFNDYDLVYSLFARAGKVAPARETQSEQRRDG